VMIYFDVALILRHKAFAVMIYFDMMPSI
jgi:hypothetical protein